MYVMTALIRQLANGLLGIHCLDAFIGEVEASKAVFIVFILGNADPLVTDFGSFSRREADGCSSRRSGYEGRINK